MLPQDSHDSQLGQGPVTPLTPASGQATMPLPITGTGGYMQSPVTLQSSSHSGTYLPSEVPEALVPIAPTVLQPTVPVYAVDQASGRQPDDSASSEQLAEAADGDVIETEWVAKAKQIVIETRLNPHLQVRQMNILKADYMKKRYNKDIKFPGI